MRDAVRVDVRQPRLPPVGARQPTEHVVEGAVLHHQHHDVLDAGVFRVRADVARHEDGGIEEATVAAAQGDSAGRRGAGGEESAARDYARYETSRVRAGDYLADVTVGSRRCSMRDLVAAGRRVRSEGKSQRAFA